MRLLLLIVLVFAAMGLAGCGIPRMISLDLRIKDPGLVIPGGTRSYVRLQPDVIFLYSTGSTTRIHSSRPPEETFAWYEETFAKQGWKWDEESLKSKGTLASGATLPRDQVGVWNFTATRPAVWKVGVGAIPTGTERIDLHIDMGYRGEEPTGCYVDIELCIQSIWDWPSRIGVGVVMMPAALVLQEGVMLLAPVYIWF